MRERNLLTLRFSIPEPGEKAWCSSIAISFGIEFLLENVWFIGRSGLEVKAFIRQCHCVICRDVSLENTSRPSFELTFVLLICIHMGQTTVIRMIGN